MHDTLRPYSHKLPPIQRCLFYLLSFSISMMSSSLYAYQETCASQCWRPIIALAAGYISSSNLGESQNFPIQNPAVDSFYNYSPNSGTKTSGIGDAFVGVEWPWGGSGWSFQLGLGYNQSAPFTFKGTLVQGADTASQATFGYSFDVSLRQLLVEAKLLTAIASYYHPYLFGGAGIAFNKASQFGTTVPPFLTFTRNYKNNTNTVFSYSVGAGIDFDLDQAFRVGIGYRFSDYGQVKLGNATIDNTAVSGTLSQNHVYTNELIAQITYGFG